MTPATAFYCVSDERFFLGAVGLINSLRLVGHSEPIYVLDVGLTAPQRELLAAEVELVACEAKTPPTLLKTIAPLAHPAEVMVLIDADMIVTRPLDELIDEAARGRVVAVEHGSERFCAEWEQLPGIGELHRRPYVSGALLFCEGRAGSEILSLMDRYRDAVDFEQTTWRRNVPGYPYLYGDQDLLNAVLCSRGPSTEVAVLDRRLEALMPFEGLRVTDESTLACAYADGLRPFALHHYLNKPWLELTLEGPYNRLLRRLLLAGDVAVRVPVRSLPRHLRAGYLAEAVRRRGNGQGRFRSYLGEPLASRIRALRGHQAR
jgi:hypothetical protein